VKFKDTSGREHKIQITPSRWKRKGIDGRGKYQSEVGQWLAEFFPGDFILEEFPCKGDGLFLDFFLPRNKIAVEVQGAQHIKFNPFFHRDKAAFQDQQRRDVTKHRWCEINTIRLVIIPYGWNKEKVAAALDKNNDGL